MTDYECERRVLVAARSRCRNPRDPAYSYYGGRGIRMCEEWCGRHGFDMFLAHIGPRPDKSYTLDRINNDGNYEPGNVRWATRVEQANNRRTSRWITWRGETHTATQWARLLGVRHKEIILRADAGRPLDKGKRRKRKRKTA